jgi:hypothetical protein
MDAKSGIKRTYGGGVTNDAELVKEGGIMWNIWWVLI